MAFARDYYSSMYAIHLRILFDKIQQLAVSIPSLFAINNILPSFNQRSFNSSVNFLFSIFQTIFHSIFQRSEANKNKSKISANILEHFYVSL